MVTLTFADWLNDQLNSKPQLNQVALAINLGLSQSSVSNWIRGLYVPQPENCRKIARFFDIPEDDVLVVAGHRQPLPIRDRTHVAEASAAYDITARTRINQLLDNFTTPQLEALLTFLEILQ